MSWLNLISILAVVALLWYVFDSMRAREIATAIAHRYCVESQLQFLDGTVGLYSVTVHRSKRGIEIRRCYEFYYSSEDYARHRGLIVMRGTELEHFLLFDHTA